MNTPRTIAALAMAGAMFTAAAPIHAADTQASPEVRSFLEEAAMGGMAEVELGKLAQARAGDKQVKQFGKRMVADHGKANAALKKLAAKKGITLPTGIGPDHTAMRNQLAELSGEEFDKAYVDGMKKDHAKDIAAFEQAAESSPDADVRSFAKRTLPTLRAHAKQVGQLEKTVGAGMAAPRHAAHAH